MNLLNAFFSKVKVGSVVTGIFLFVPVALLAQDISQKQREEAVSAETRLEAAERIQQQTDDLDQEEDDKKKQKRGPDLSLEDYKDQTRKLSAEELERLKRQVQRKNKRMIEKLNRIIERDPYNDRRPDWMFQKAELMWEVRNKEYLRKREEYNQCVTAKDQGTAQNCQEPEPDYSAAREIYRQILRKYPDYSRLDEVLYRLGSGLIQADKTAEGVEKLNRLVEEYPNSKYLPDSRLALAEEFFSQELLGAARENYNAVLEYPNNPNYNYALYKLGWVLYNQKNYEQSIDTFHKVVDKTDAAVGFQKQALSDMVMGYAEVKNGWQRARKYYTKVRDKQFAYGKLNDLAGVYESQGKNRKAIAVYNYFIDKRPNHPDIPVWMKNITMVRKGMGNLPALEKSMNRFIAYLNPNGAWAAQNSGNDKALKKANQLVKSSLAYLSNKYHRMAQDSGKNKQYSKAVKYYSKYIDRFPNDPASFDMNFFLADIYLLKLDNYGKAAQYYQKVVDLYKNDNVPEGAKEKQVKAIVQDSAFGVVNAYNELVKKNHKDSILVKMAKYEEKHDGKQYRTKGYEEGTDKEPNPKVELLKYEKKFVKASDQYSEMYPETDVTPTIDYVAAEVYKARGHYSECIDRYESIIENAPDHRYASFAGNSLLVANYRLKNWKEVEKWARHLLENKIFDVTPKDSLEQSIAYAINKQAQELDKAGEGKKAATKMVALAEEFPESQFAPGALFNAAAFYESNDKVQKAVDLYTRVVDEYPKDKMAPEAIFVMGAIFESRANFDRAARYFEKLGTSKTYEIDKKEGDGTKEKKYSQHSKSADAIYNAAVLREAMEQWQNAINTYQKYVKEYPDRENINDVKLKLAYLEQKQGDSKKALERFKTYSKIKDLEDKTKLVEVDVEIAKLIEKLQQVDDWEKKASERYKAALDRWKKIKDKKKKKKYRNYAAEARFRETEHVYDDFTEVALEFPMETLTDSLDKKAKLQQEAEKKYFKVIDMKSPRWVAASAFRIGQMYQDFSNQIFDLPLPKGLSPRQEAQYRAKLDERAFPLETKALKAFETALNLALKYQAYNEWSSRSAKKISNLKSSSYPITDQEGVDVEHGRIDFYVPESVASLDKVTERAKKRIERRRKRRKRRQRRKKKQQQKQKQKEEPSEGAEESGTQAMR